MNLNTISLADVRFHHESWQNSICSFRAMTVASGVGVGLKVGDKYSEDWRGGIWGGAVPSPVGGLGLAPEKKILC